MDPCVEQRGVGLGYFYSLVEAQIKMLHLPTPSDNRVRIFSLNVHLNKKMSQFWKLDCFYIKLWNDGCDEQSPKYVLITVS